MAWGLWFRFSGLGVREIRCFVSDMGRFRRHSGVNVVFTSRSFTALGEADKAKRVGREVVVNQWFAIGTIAPFKQLSPSLHSIPLCSLHTMKLWKE